MLISLRAHQLMIVYMNTVLNVYEWLRQTRCTAFCVPGSVVENNSPTRNENEKNCIGKR